MNRPKSILAFAAFAASVSAPLLAAPWGSWLKMRNDQPGVYLEATGDSLNPGTGLTIELFVRSQQMIDNCSSLVGKGWTESYWVGICGGHLRSYVSGSASQITAGTVPVGRWVHLAISTDGVNRRHYIDGIEVANVPEPIGAPTGSALAFRIGSDPSYEQPANVDIDDVRLYTVSRTGAQIAAARNEPDSATGSGLAGVWHLDFDGSNSSGGPAAATVGDVVWGDSSCLRSWIVPAAAHAAGLGGSNWVTDLTLVNRDSFDAVARISFLPRGADNSSSTSVEVPLPALGSVSLPDVLSGLFGASEAAGALLVCDYARLRVFTRTYNVSETGTFGQGIPGIPTDEVMTAGPEYLLPALSENSTTRTNIGFANPSPYPTLVAVRLFSGDGVELGSVTETLFAYGNTQIGQIFRRVTGGDVTGGWALVSTSDTLTAYASVIDNATGDGTYVEAE